MEIENIRIGLLIKAKVFPKAKKEELEKKKILLRFC